MSWKRISAPFALVALLSCTNIPTNKGDLRMDEKLFIGGVVAAGPQQTPQRDWAIYVRNGRVEAIGPAADLRNAHPGIDTIDASNSTILPGLTDAHGHLYGLGLAIDIVDLVGSSSFDEV
ncbi:MAG TPA: hypothetical protein VJ032_04705, partial [Thermoanaerobaculia bacterium]|nr:hypothetical protein [Thermoanaerobaculia bacterium]